LFQEFKNKCCGTSYKIIKSTDVFVN